MLNTARLLLCTEDAMKRRTLTAVSLVLLALVGAAVAQQQARQEADHEKCQARLKKDVTFLASPECEGRGPRTQGLKKAGDYLAAEFAKIGLEPAFGTSYFQPFTMA